MCWFAIAAAGAQDADRSARGEFLKGEYSTAGAMSVVYGNYDPDTKMSEWEMKTAPELGLRWPQVIQVRVLADESYMDGNVQRRMLTTWAKPDESGAREYSCQGCGVLLGVSVFRKESGGWRVERSELQLGTVGASARPPKTKVQRLGPHAWGLVATFEDMRGAQAEQAAWIYGPEQGGFREWFKVQLVDDDKYGEFPQDDWCKVRAGELDVLCVWREIDYAMHPQEGKQVYDLVKTRRTPTGVEQESWRFDGQGFVKVGKHPGGGAKH